jgi:iron complex transport system ATP-binding protein
MTAALEINDLTVSLGARDVVRGVTASIPAGKFVAVCGLNGSGKTTLLRAALGLSPTKSGGARVFGHDPHALSPAARANQIAYLPQDRRVAWGLPSRAVVELGAINHPPAIARERADAALAAVDMRAFAERSVFELSGGERARVLLARLLAQQAPLMVLDEPIAGLDPDAQLMTLELLRAQVDAGATVVATLHDLLLCERFADLALVLDDGCLAAFAPPREALSPALLSSAFRLEAEWVETSRGQFLSAKRSR